jgi:hypothetical protein
MGTERHLYRELSKDIQALDRKICCVKESIPEPAVSSPIEEITEGANTGWRVVGADPANYGDIGNGAWDFSNQPFASTTKGATGTNSFAFGFQTEASGYASTAWGRDTEASGYSSTAFGSNTTATEYASTAWGIATTASGAQSTAWGQENTANSRGATVFGNFATIAAGQSATTIVATDELLKIGNGTSTGARSDAFTMYKNSVTLAGGISGVDAVALTPVNGMSAYVTSTSGVFTTTGWWDYERGAWRARH